MIDGARRVAGGLVLLISAATPANAEIHEHEIRRLLYLHTPCGVLELERLTDLPDSRRFRAVCKNVSAYPDGVSVICTDINDDRSCRVETAPKEFKLLRQVKPN